MKMRTLYGKAQNHHRILRGEEEDMKEEDEEEEEKGRITGAGKGQIHLVVSLQQSANCSFHHSYF